MNEQAIWKLAQEGGMSALTVERLANETDQNALDLASVYPEPAFMVVGIVEEIHNNTMQSLAPSALATHDHLIDVVMAHLDACLPHRQTIQRLWSDLVSMPTVLLTLRPYLMKIVDRILQHCGLEENTILAPVRLRAYFALFLYVLYVWIYDDTSQQEKTLVALDQGLKRLGDIPW
jgi:hypothetical protein